MIVFSNTTPFIALSSIGQLDLLPRMFGKIHVVDAVADECAAGGPISVPDLRRTPWVEVVHVDPAPPPATLIDLDLAEKLTLHMALLLNADRVLIDEKLGREMAEYLGLAVTGTLGILLKARQAGWIASFLEPVLAMRALGLRYNLTLVHRLGARVGESP